MPTNSRIVIVAGEESGDQHAANLIHSLKMKLPDLKVFGVGGTHLANEGVELISDIAKYGITGISNVISHAFVIKNAFKTVKNFLKNNQPDLLILVDYPGFNLRLAKYAKQQLGLKILYYISPQIWAWKPRRLETVKQYVDHMAVILPFEKKIYDQAAVKVSFVGHPLIEKIKKIPAKPLARRQLNLPPNAFIMGLLPGSRRGEVKLLMPILAQAATKVHALYPDVHFVVPIAQTLDEDAIKKACDLTSLPITFISGQATTVMSAADAVVVASGTASLETALLQKPMCIIYKSSPLSYLIAMRLINVRYLGLCNLLMDKMIVPELLQDDCRVETLFKEMIRLIEEKETSLRMKKRLLTLYNLLSSDKADCSVAALAHKMLTSS